MTTSSGSGRPAGDAKSGAQPRHSQDWKTDQSRGEPRSPAQERRRNLLIATTGTLLGLAAVGYFVYQIWNAPPATQVAIIGVNEYDNRNMPANPQAARDEAELKRLKGISGWKVVSDSSKQPGKDAFRAAVKNCNDPNLVIYCDSYGKVITGNDEKPAAALVLKDGSEFAVRDLIKELSDEADGKQNPKNVLLVLNTHGIKPNWALGVLADDYQSRLQKDLGDATSANSKITVLTVNEPLKDEASANETSQFVGTFVRTIGTSNGDGRITLDKLGNSLKQYATHRYPENRNQEEKVEFAVGTLADRTSLTDENKPATDEKENKSEVTDATTDTAKKSPAEKENQPPATVDHKPKIVIPRTLALLKDNEIAKDTGVQVLVDQFIEQRKAAAPDAKQPPDAKPSGIAAWFEEKPAGDAADKPAADPRVKLLQLAIVLHAEAKDCEGDPATLHALQQLADEAAGAAKKAKVFESDEQLPDEIQLIRKLGVAAGKSKDEQWPKTQCARLIEVMDTFEKANAEAAKAGIDLNTLSAESNAAKLPHAQDFLKNLYAAKQWILNTDLPGDLRERRAAAHLEAAAKAVIEIENAVKKQFDSVALKPQLQKELPDVAQHVADGAESSKSSKSVLANVDAKWFDRQTQIDTSSLDQAGQELLKVTNAFNNVETQSSENKETSDELSKIKETWEKLRNEFESAKKEKVTADKVEADSNGIWQAFWAIQVLTLADKSNKDDLVKAWCKWAEDSKKSTDVQPSDDLVKQRIALGDEIRKLSEKWKHPEAQASTDPVAISGLSDAPASSFRVVTDEKKLEVNDKHGCQIELSLQIPAEAKSLQRFLEIQPAPATVKVNDSPEVEHDVNRGIDLKDVESSCKLALTWTQEPDFSASPLTLILLEEHPLSRDSLTPAVPVAVRHAPIRGYVDPTQWKITFKDANDKTVYEAKPSADGSSVIPLSVHTFAEGLVLRPYLTRPKNEVSTSIAVTMAATENELNGKLSFDELKETRLAKGGVPMPLPLMGAPLKDHVLPHELAFEIKRNLPEDAAPVVIKVPLRPNTAVDDLITEVASPAFVSGADGDMIRVTIRRGDDSTLAKIGLPAETAIPVSLEIAGFPSLTTTLEDVPPAMNIDIAVQLDPEQSKTLQTLPEELDIWLTVAGVPHSHRWHGRTTTSFEAGFRNSNRVAIAAPRDGEVWQPASKTKSGEPAAPGAPANEPPAMRLAVDKGQFSEASENLDLEATLFTGHRKADTIGGNSQEKRFKGAKFIGLPYASKVALSTQPDGSWKLTSSVDDFRILATLNPGQYTLRASLVGPDGLATSTEKDVEVVEFAVDGSPPKIADIKPQLQLPKVKRTDLKENVVWNDLPLVVTCKAVDAETDVTDVRAGLFEQPPATVDAVDFTTMIKGGEGDQGGWTFEFGAEELSGQKGLRHLVVIAKNKNGLSAMASKQIQLVPPLTTLRVTFRDTVRYLSLEGDGFRKQDRGELNKLNLDSVRSPQEFTNLRPGKYTLIAARNDSRLFFEKHLIEIKEGETLIPVEIGKLEEGTFKDLEEDESAPTAAKP